MPGGGQASETGGVQFAQGVVRLRFLNSPEREAVEVEILKGKHVNYAKI